MTTEEVKSLLRKFPQFEDAFVNLKIKYREEINPMIDTLDFVDPKSFEPQAGDVKIQIPETDLNLIANQNAEFSIF